MGQCDNYTTGLKDIVAMWQNDNEATDQWDIGLKGKRTMSQWQLALWQCDNMTKGATEQWDTRTRQWCANSYMGHGAQV